MKTPANTPAGARWCRAMSEKCCSFYPGCGYVHVEAWLEDTSGMLMLPSLLAKDRRTLLVAIEGAIERMEAALAKQCCAYTARAQLLDVIQKAGIPAHSIACVENVINLFCSTMHYDLDGMSLELKRGLRSVLQHISPYLERAVRKTSTSASDEATPVTVAQQPPTIDSIASPTVSPQWRHSASEISAPHTPCTVDSVASFPAPSPAQCHEASASLVPPPAFEEDSSSDDFDDYPTAEFIALYYM
ncbi:hypothetical protein DIPPA_18569 [Diplonema papillatum]|nr:hypothetical protein DIPPA_18569 [Diplonema papillatum]